MFTKEIYKKKFSYFWFLRFFRRTDWMIAAFCFSLVIGIYSYTMFAIQQEQNAI